MPNISFTMEEVLQIREGKESETLKAKINEAENLEKFKALREAVKDRITDNANTFIKDHLASLSIPSGIQEIALTYNLSQDTYLFGCLTTGVKVTYSGEGAVTEEITDLVTKAEFAKVDRKNPAPLAFLVKSLGESRVNHIITLRDFNAKGKPALDALYTYENAKPLSEGVSEIPTGDRCRLQIKYRHDAPVEGKEGTKAAWLYPDVKVGKTISSGSGNGGGQGFRVTAPEGYRSWTEWGNSGVDAEAKALYDNIVAEKGEKFQSAPTSGSAISFANILKKGKHPVYLEQLEIARSKKEDQKTDPA